MNNLETLGQKIREARAKKKLTLDQLTALTGINKVTIANIEKGRVNPTYKTLETLGKFLNIKIFGRWYVN